MGAGLGAQGLGAGFGVGGSCGGVGVWGQGFGEKGRRDAVGDGNLMGCGGARWSIGAWEGSRWCRICGWCGDGLGDGLGDGCWSAWLTVGPLFESSPERLWAASASAHPPDLPPDLPSDLPPGFERRCIAIRGYACGSAHAPRQSSARPSGSVATFPPRNLPYLRSNRSQGRAQHGQPYCRVKHVNQRQRGGG